MSAWQIVQIDDSTMPKWKRFLICKKNAIQQLKKKDLKVLIVMIILYIKIANKHFFGK